jgi:hypothetical protein
MNETYEDLYTDKDLERWRMSAPQVEQTFHEAFRDCTDDQLEIFATSMEKGSSPRFALLCAMQQAPGTRHSDRTFNAERMDHMRSMHPKQRAAYLARAKQAGISTQGKFYVGGLGAPTDPEAWVSTVDDAKEVAKRKNLTASGLFENQGVAQGPKRVRMADDVRDRLVAARLKADPKARDRVARNPDHIRKIQGQVVDRHSRPSRS